MVPDGRAPTERAGPLAPRPCVHGLDLAGRYQVGSLIRADRRGCTHHAQDTLLRRRVSVTLATPEAGFAIPSTLPLPASARDGHGPGLGEILDGGDDHGTLYLVIQAPEARTLAEELRDHRFTAHEVRDLGAGITRALLPAHRRGWAHGALEADTVGLGPDRVTVAGLGVDEWLAHWAQVQEPPRHPAPEQLAEREISPATDIFALGALLAEAVGPLPPGDPLAVLLARMRTEDPAGRPTTEQVLRLLTSPELDLEPAPAPTAPAAPSAPSAWIALSTPATTAGAFPSRATATALWGLAALAAAFALVVVVAGTGTSSPARSATLSDRAAAPVLVVAAPPVPAPQALGRGRPVAVFAVVGPAAPGGQALLGAAGDAPTPAARPRDGTSDAPDSSITSYPVGHEQPSLVRRPADHPRATTTATATTARVSSAAGGTPGTAWRSPGPRTSPAVPGPGSGSGSGSGSDSAATATAGSTAVEVGATAASRSPRLRMPAASSDPPQRQPSSAPSSPSLRP